MKSKINQYSIEVVLENDAQENRLGGYERKIGDKMYCTTQLGWGSPKEYQNSLTDVRSDLKDVKFIYLCVYREKMNGVLCGQTFTYRISRKSIIEI
jgi:hypothetical protein